MKKITLLLLLGIVVGSTAKAQTPITLTRADFGVADDTIRYDVDTIPNPGFSIDTAGYNQNWDFTSSFDRDRVTVLRFDDQTTQPFLTFPAGSNLATSFDGDYVNANFLEASSSGVKIIIMNTIDPGDELGRIQFISFPATYGTETRDSFTAQRTYHKNDIGFGSIPFIDSIRITVNVRSVFKMDGFGNLTLRAGVYSTLRQNGNVKITPTVEGRNPLNGSYSPLPINIGSQDQRNVAWIGTNSKFDYLSVTQDTTGAPTSIRYLYHAPPIGVAEQDLAKGFFFSPNPSNGTLWMANQTGAPLQVSLLSLDGKQVTVWNLEAGAHEINAQVPAGLYLLQYQDEAGLHSKKLLIQ